MHRYHPRKFINLASESLKLTVFSVQEVFIAVTTAAALSYAMLSTFPNQHLLPTK